MVRCYKQLNPYTVIFILTNNSSINNHICMYTCIHSYAHARASTDSCIYACIYFYASRCVSIEINIIFLKLKKKQT